MASKSSGARRRTKTQLIKERAARSARKTRQYSPAAQAIFSKAERSRALESSVLTLARQRRAAFDLIGQEVQVDGSSGKQTVAGKLRSVSGSQAHVQLADGRAVNVHVATIQVSK